MAYETSPQKGAGLREMYRVVPSTEAGSTSNIDKHLTSLADLGASNRKQGFLSRAVEPFLDDKDDENNIKFEFVAISQGEDEAVELYYSASGRQKTLKKRLRAIYPSSFEIKKVHIDLGHKLLKPIKLSRNEFKARLKADHLYRDREEYFSNDIDGQRELKSVPPGLRSGYKKRGSGPIKSYALEDALSQQDTTTTPNFEIDNGNESKAHPAGSPSENTTDSTTNDSQPIDNEPADAPSKDTDGETGGEATESDSGSTALDEDEYGPAADLFIDDEDGGDDESSPSEAPESSTDGGVSDEEPDATESQPLPPSDESSDSPSDGSESRPYLNAPDEADSDERVNIHPNNDDFGTDDERVTITPLSPDENGETRVSVKIDAKKVDGPINPFKLRYENYGETEAVGDTDEGGNGSGGGDEGGQDERDDDNLNGLNTEEVAAYLGGLHSSDDAWEHSQQVVIDDEDIDGEPIQGVVELNPPEDINDNDPLVALDGPTLTEDGDIYIRPDIKYSEPNAVRWYGYEETPKDWMTTLDTATESNPEYEDGGSDDDDAGNPESLETLFSHLETAEDPIGYQVVFEAKDNWEKQAQRRKRNIRKGEFDEPILEKILGGSPTDEDRDLKAYEYRRIKLIENKRPTETFNVNIRCVSLAPKTDFTNDSDDPAPPTNQQQRISQTLQEITPLLDPLDGIYYGLEGEVAKKNSSYTDTEPTADEVVVNFFERNIILKEDLEDPLGPLNVWDDSKKHPEIVANGRELGEFIVIPSGDDMDDDVFRSTGVRDKDIEPLPRPRPEIHKQFKQGVSIGYAYDDHGIPEDEPTCIPEDQLTNHWAMFGASGSGKTINTISMLLSAHRDTDGPTILVDPKQGNMVENYCKAHYEEFDDLQDVMVFDVPEALPAVPFFDIRPYLYEGMNRDDAIQTKVDEFHLIMQMVDENYDTAYVAKTVLGALIKSNFDKKYGADSFTLEDLYETAVGMYANETIPRVSHQPQVRNILSNQLNNSESEFKNTMQAVINRLDDLQEDINLYRLFNQNPEWDDDTGQYVNNDNDITDYDVDDPNDFPEDDLKNALDFRQMLDDDTVVLFDTGDFVRDQSQRAFSMYILSALWGAVRARYKDRRSHESIDSTVKLIIEESAPIVSTELVTNTLIPEGREFGLSLGFIMQFPGQVSANGVNGSFDEIRTNVQTKIYGQIDPSREIADGLVHGEKDATTIKNKIRRLPGGEWIVNLPEPAFGVDVPPPFSIRSLEIPDGHPDSENPMSPHERTVFYERYELRQTKTRKRHGLTRIDPEKHGLLEKVENFDFSDDGDDAEETGDADAGDTTETSASSDAPPAGGASSPDRDGDGDGGQGFGGFGSDQQTTVGDKDGSLPGEGQSASSPGESTSPESGGEDDDEWTKNAVSRTRESQDDAETAPDSNTESGAGGDSALFDNIDPLPFTPIKDILTEHDFGEPDQLQAAVFALEEKYDPVTQPERFRQGIKTLAREAHENGQDITAKQLEESVTEGSGEEATGETTVDDVDPTADSGAPDATELDTGKPDEGGVDDADGSADDDTTFSVSDGVFDEDNNDSERSTTEETPTANGDAPAAGPADEKTGWGAVKDAIEDNDTDDGGDDTDDESSEVDPEIADSLRDAGVSDDDISEAAKAIEDMVKSSNVDADGDEDHIAEAAEAAEDVATTATSDGEQPDDSADQSESADEDSNPDHPAKATLNTPLHGQESLLSQEKRESVDLTRDDIKFLALVADAFRDELDGYTLTESMNDFDERAGNPDLEALIENEYVEKMTVNRRTYYSLTRKGWRLINDGVPGNKFGDHMEKIAHRVGVFLLAEHLRNLPVSKVVEYGRHDGETFDVIAYDTDGNIHTVGEVETKSNNTKAVVEDYEKLADAPGKAVWAFPKNPVFEEVWDALEGESLVDDEIPDWKTERTVHMRDILAENPEAGMENVLVYSQLRDSIGGGDQ